MDELTPEQLEAILGTDYETVLADILRQKADAETRKHQEREIGQVGDGNVFFDPAGALDNYLGQRRAGKDYDAAQKSMDDTLAQQKDTKRKYIEALLQKQAPQSAPRSVDSTLPEQAPPVPGMAPGAPPALANASQMPPGRLQGAGVPPDVQALLAKLRGQ